MVHRNVWAQVSLLGTVPSSATTRLDVATKLPPGALRIEIFVDSGEQGGRICSGPHYVVVGPHPHHLFFCPWAGEVAVAVAVPGAKAGAAAAATGISSVITGVSPGKVPDGSCRMGSGAGHEAKKGGWRGMGRRCKRGGGDRGARKDGNECYGGRLAPAKEAPYCSHRGV